MSINAVISHNNAVPSALAAYLGGYLMTPICTADYDPLKILVSLLVDNLLDLEDVFFTSSLGLGAKIYFR